MLTEIKIPNSLDSSTLSENWKNMGFRELFLPKNDFKTCSRVNSRKWLKNRNLWFSELYFYLKYISNKDDIWQGETLPGVLLEERELNKILKKSIMAAQKCKNILLQAALKDFWSSANPKLKKLSLPKLSLLQDHTEENARMGVLGSYFCLQVI